MRHLLLAAVLAFQLPASAPQAAYVFSYFVNNGEDGLHLLSSTDGLQWTTLNGGRSFMYPAVGSRLMRDPSITRGPDGMFHLVWTTGWWDKGIGIAHSKDLIEWSDQEFLPVMADRPDALNCWAPEIFFDEETGRYLIFWATSPTREPASAHRIYYVETRDFKTYTPAKVLYDGGFSVIDAFIVRPSRGRYVMVLKDETALPTPKKHLRIAEATRAEGPYGPASAPISVDWVEGPSVLKQGSGWIMFYDEYTRRRYGALQSSDLKQWTPVQGLNFPRGVRHGTAFEVPMDVAARLAGHSTEATAARWRQTPAGIEWPADQLAASPKPHDDHLEMSGLNVSVIVQYGVDRAFRLKEETTSVGGGAGVSGGRWMLWRGVVWPMLRTFPNDTHASLPQAFAPSALAEIVMISDFWSPLADVRRTLAQLSGTGAHGHTVQVVDPAEETFPYNGRVEFIEPEGAGSITAGRAETWKADYETRVSAHRAAIRAETDKLGWSFAIHRTDRPATELLLALHARMGAPPPGAVTSGRVTMSGQRGRHA